MSARPEDADVRLMQAISYTLGVHVTLDDAAKVRAALRAAGFEVEQGWQPISTARRDVSYPEKTRGTPLLAWSPEHGQAVIHYEYHHYCWAAAFDNWPLEDFQPTHWRLLPQPPKEANDES